MQILKHTLHAETWWTKRKYASICDGLVLPPIAQYETYQVDENDSLNANNELPFLRSTLGSLRSMLLNFPSRDTVNIYDVIYPIHPIVLPELLD